MQDPIQILILIAAGLTCGTIGFTTASLLAATKRRQIHDEAWRMANIFHRAQREQAQQDAEPCTPRSL